MILTEPILIDNLNEIDLAVKWCEKNIGYGVHVSLAERYPLEYDWFYYNKITGAMLFYFRNKEDAAQFKLAWA